MTLQKDKDDLEDDDKYADHIDMPGQKFETKQRITVRNLRIREDTAKVGVMSVQICDLKQRKNCLEFAGM